MDIFWASVVTSAVMGVASYLLIVLAERVFVPWQSALLAGAGATNA
jgi:NitT/TauT family transport system permease protein